MALTVVGPRTYRVRMIARASIAPDVVLISLALLDPTDMPSRAGQFVMLHAITPDGTIAKRSYSIVEVAQQDGASVIVLCVKLLPLGTASTYLNTLEVGAEMEISGPFGRFGVSPRPVDTPRLFIATGTGIAPFVGMAQDLVAAGATEVMVLAGFRSSSDIILCDRLVEILGDARVLVTLTRPDSTWAGRVGRVTDHIPRIVASMPGVEASLCGNPEMVEDCRAMLLTAGIALDHILFEKFTSPGKAAFLKAS